MKIPTIAAAHDMHAERACLVALSTLAGIGPATLLACRNGPGGTAAWDALRSGRGQTIQAFADLARRQRDPDLLARLARIAATIDPCAMLARHEAAGHQVVLLGDAMYPERLSEDPFPPAVLFADGDLACLAAPTVAIVGTRNATQLGRQTAGNLAVELGRRGIAIVSGLALGIDGAAHQALIAGAGPGRAIGVVATGLERSYPRRHELLHRQVAASGVLMSESPMGSEPSRWRFPARNRIIAGLADAVVVVESRSSGGSMVTAAEALARNVPVLAVPGHPTSSASAGSLDLICDGAMPVRDVGDVLVAMGMGGSEPLEALSGEQPGPPNVGTVAQGVLEELVANPRTLSELLVAQALDLSSVSAALVELEQAGLVVRSGVWFERTVLATMPMTPEGGR